MSPLLEEGGERIERRKMNRWMRAMTVIMTTMTTMAMVMNRDDEDGSGSGNDNDDYGDDNANTKAVVVVIQYGSIPSIAEQMTREWSSQ